MLVAVCRVINYNRQTYIIYLPSPNYKHIVIHGWSYLYLPLDHVVLMNFGPHPLFSYRRERRWSLRLQSMEINVSNSRSVESLYSGGFKNVIQDQNLTEKDVSDSLYVNHAEVAWHEMRRAWVGDKSQRSQRRRRIREPITWYAFFLNFPTLLPWYVFKGVWYLYLQQNQTGCDVLCWVHFHVLD